MSEDSILKKYVCKNPFEYFDVQETASYICCPSWCPTRIEKENDRLGWDGTTIKKIQKSVLDGSYKYCNKKVCPSLNNLINNGKVSENFVKKEDFLKHYEITDINDVNNINFDCKNILFGFDRSCNLKCPSCRLSMVINDGVESLQYNYKMKVLETIESKLSKTIESILITGSGDPFYSNIYRNYLINFDETKYPNLKEIRLITNGIMLDKKMWNSLNAKKFIKQIEVSIDAGTKETYENVTRINGNWDRLVRNLKFISTLKTVNYFQLSFVVSELNYKEMIKFYQLITQIFIGRNFEVIFRQHVYWGMGKYTEEEVENISIFNKTHKNHNLFLDELYKIHSKPLVDHNFHHLIEKNKIIKRLL